MIKAVSQLVISRPHIKCPSIVAGQCVVQHGLIIGYNFAAVISDSLDFACGNMGSPPGTVSINEV